MPVQLSDPLDIQLWSRDLPEKGLMEEDASNLLNTLSDERVSFVRLTLRPFF